MCYVCITDYRFVIVSICVRQLLLKEDDYYDQLFDEFKKNQQDCLQCCYSNWSLWKLRISSCYWAVRQRRKRRLLRHAASMDRRLPSSKKHQNNHCINDVVDSDDSNCQLSLNTLNKKDGYRQQNLRQRQKLISIIDYDVCILEYLQPFWRYWTSKNGLTLKSV